MTHTLRLLRLVTLGLLAVARLSAALPNGIAAGDTTYDSTVLWARSDALGTVNFNVYSDSALTQLVKTSSATVTDINVPVKVEVTGLSAATPYFYKATDSTASSLAGQFKTFAPTGRNGLSFGVSGDWRGELAGYPSVKNLAAKNLDFFVALGDTIYADDASKVSPTFTNPAQASSLTEFRAKHQEVYTSTNGLNTLADIRRSTTVFSMIDDHEVTNDFAGGALISSDARFAGTGAPNARINTSTLFQNGIQAFKEYNPIKSETWANTGTDPRMDGVEKLYRARTFGTDAALILVDARTFRDTEVDTTNPATAAQVYTPGRTIFGERQLSQLQADLLAAQQNGVLWKFVALPEPAQQLGAFGAGDRPEGYYAERTALLAFIKTNNIQNVVFIAADIHGTSVNDLRFPSNGNPFTGTSIHSGAWEITTGSVAYQQPFGPTIEQIAASPGFQLYGTSNVLQAMVGYGILTPTQFATLSALPTQSERNTQAYTLLLGANLTLRNALLHLMLNGQLATDALYGALDAIGLDASVINYTVQAGDTPGTLTNEAFFQTYVYGSTQFDIDPITGALKVTTYGIPGYTEAELTANPSLIAGLTPQIMSQFTVYAVSAIPEPSTTAALVGAAVLALAALRRRRA